MDARTRRGLLPAVVGLLLGIVAVAADQPVFGLVGGACGLLVLLATMTTGRRRTGAVPEPTAGGVSAAPATAAPAQPARPDVPALRPEAAPPARPRPAEPPAVPASAGGLASGADPSRAQGQADANGGPGSSLVDRHGLFSEEYFLLCVETRVSAARRHLRPVAVVLLELGAHPGEAPLDPALVATAIRSTLREADTACRLTDGRYGFVLEDTPEDGALWTMERFRRSLQTIDPGAIRWAGIACYPAHAFSAEGILAKAELALTSAKEWGQDRIEVAAVD